jgi:hypothetical protein
MSEHFKLEKSEKRDASLLSVGATLWLNISSKQNPGLVNHISAPLTGFGTGLDTGEVEVKLELRLKNGSVAHTSYIQRAGYGNLLFDNSVVSADLTFVSADPTTIVLRVDLYN